MWGGEKFFVEGSLSGKFCNGCGQSVLSGFGIGMLASEAGKSEHIADGGMFRGFDEKLLGTMRGGDVIELYGKGDDAVQAGFIELITGNLLQGVQGLGKVRGIKLKLRKLTQGGGITGEAFEETLPQKGCGATAAQGDIDLSEQTPAFTVIGGCFEMSSEEIACRGRSIAGGEGLGELRS